MSRAHGARFVGSFLAIAGLMLALAAPAGAASGQKVEIMVMKHACKSSIQSEADFKAVEAKGGGTGTVGGLVQTVLACPTIALPGEKQAAGAIAGAPASFNFTVTGSDGKAQTFSDSMFQSGKLCETDVKLDANGDGKISPNVCLDVSHHMFSVAGGQVTVTETNPPPGFRFGTLRTTPVAIDKNNDLQSVQAFGGGVIRLNTTPDKDGKIMLHVYNFTGAASMPNGAMSVPAPAPVNPVPLVGLGLLGLGAIGGGLAFARRSR